jgi:hypothetical protein
MQKKYSTNGIDEAVIANGNALLPIVYLFRTAISLKFNSSLGNSFSFVSTFAPTS